MRSPATWDYKRVVAVAFVVGVFMDVLDVTIVNVALPTIGRRFGSSDTGLEWVVTAYLLSLAVWIPASGWFGDRIGTKRVFLTALAVFTLGSAMCGLAQSIGQLIAFRVAQGVGGGMMVPVGQSMLFRAFPPGERARASAVLSIPSVLGPALGPVLGGVITTHASWRWIFLINIPFGFAAFAFSARYLKEHREPTAGEFDRGGFMLSALAFGSLLFGLAEVPRRGWRAPISFGPALAGLVLLGVLVAYEAWHPDPMLAFRLFRDRMFRVGSIVYVSFSRDESVMGVGFPKEQREWLVGGSPDKFMLPQASDMRYHWVLVRLAAIDEKEMRELVLDAWRMVVPKRVAAAHDE